MVMYLTISIGFQWSTRMLTHLLHVPVDFFERRHIGDIVSRFGSVSAIQQTVTTGVIEGILDGLLGIATLIMIWLYSPQLALTAIAAVLALTALQFLAFEPLKRIGNEGLVADARVSTNFLESIRGMRSLKLANRMDIRRLAWQNLSVDSINVKVRQQWLSMAIGTVGALITGLQRIVAIYLAASMISRGEFTIGMLFAYLAYQDQFMSGSGGMIKLFFDFKMLRLHFERLSDIVLTPTEDLAHFKGPESDVNALSQHQHSSFLPETQPHVEFIDVSFSYSEFSEKTLDELNFSTAGSRCTVITGRTGAGKTTILKLMLGIYKPDNGKIKINGLPIESVSREQLRQHVACVLQDDSLFAGSIRENIAFFDPAMDQARIEECARIACIHDDIVNLPMRYHTPVGDMGSTLSAGQKQRLLIARAIYRNPRILLLDEATSDLDVATELQINRNLAALDIHRIYIAHRPQTIEFGDRIVNIGNR
jgi:ATP-binding cassette subfamily B protein RaxB